MANTGTHVVMKKSLAKALMDAGVEHFAAGGTGATSEGGFFGSITPQNQYQATTPTITTQNFQPQINALQTQGANTYAQQQNLAQALLRQSQGYGPNPAQAQLAQNTGQNVNQTAALIAGQRGASANPGLAARNAATAGAGIQEAGAGEAATLQAKEELGAQNELAGLYGTEGSTANQGLGIEQGANASQNAAETTGQLGVSQINAGISQANNATFSTMLGSAANGLGSAGGLIGSGMGGGGGGGGGGAGAGMGMAALMYEGGKVPLAHALKMQKFASGGIETYATPSDPRLSMLFEEDVPHPSSPTQQKGGKSTATASVDNGSSVNNETMPQTLGGTAPVAAPVETSPIEEAMGGAIDFTGGGGVPGKAVVKGNSPKNDTQPALLSPGEDVLPRSVTMAPDAPERAKRFVEALQDKKSKEPGYGGVLKARATLKDRVSRLEQLCGGGMA